jgi:hAT family C-terminal dimerisation region
MAKDIMSIPGMSAEAERLFSSTKLMLPPSRSSLLEDGIEAAECIRSWVKLGLI